MHHLKKAFFIALGCVSLALGTIGIVLPILPTVPFYLLTAFCFANSSERLHDWFIHTTVYKKYIGSYFRRRGMTKKAKCLLIGTVTAIMVPGFILMDKVPVGRAIMLVVWMGHIFYFGFKVQTITQQEADEAMAEALED
ncbi:MAG: YbaN family protein [Faecalibacterium sp.]|nr:YbaN family protein [Faecalibacterium sp.]